MFDSNLKARWDYENSIAFAREEAEEKGRHEEALYIAKELKKEGYSVEFIAKVTKLCIEEIEKPVVLSPHKRNVRFKFKSKMGL